MATKRNWLIGCGVGCGVLVLGALAIPAGCALYFRGTMQDFDEAVASRETLERQFGAAETFVPWPAGTVPADRVEAFLRVREATHPARTVLSDRFSTLFSAAGDARALDEKGVLEKLRFGLKMARTGAGMAPDIGAFFEARNTALLDAGMGPGEYTYLYAVSYFGLLAHAPDEGPGDALSDAMDGEANVDINTGMNTSGGRVRRELRTMLASQLAALPADVDPAWRDVLAAEAAALESQRSRLPWQDGLPEPLRGSLEPYRERLAATYDPITNPFELARNEKRGPFSYTTD